MNFREHKDLKAEVIASNNPRDLKSRVNKFCEGVDVIDLQYSTHGISGWNGTNVESWSVFILYKEKGDK